jgi:hypothetical protein
MSKIARANRPAVLEIERLTIIQEWLVRFHKTDLDFWRTVCSRAFHSARAFFNTKESAIRMSWLR